MRLLILIALIYICYRVLKSWIGMKTALHQTESGGAVGRVDDEMVKDPVCEVYFPKRTGVHMKKGGQDLYFCSEACRDRYMTEPDEN